MDNILFVANMTWKIIFIVFFFGFCIFIHEFGHLLAAIWRGLHAERFSIGLGNPICKLFTWRGVEFVIGWIPFGGYVALPQLDATDIPKTQDDKALEPCKPIPRAIVAFAGPFFNILFGFVLATIMWGVGLWEAPPAPSCIVTSVPKVLPLYKDGLEITDEIIAFDGVPTTKFLEEICLDIDAADGDRKITVKRDDKELELLFHPELNPEWEAGLRPGDRIVSVNGKHFKKGAEELATEYIYNSEKQISLNIIRDGESIDIAYTPVPNPLMENLGAPFFTVSNPLALGGVRQDSPAYVCGLLTGDQLLQINNTNIENGEQFLKLLSEQAGQTFSMQIARNGEEIFIPEATCPEPYNLNSFGIQFSVTVVNCLKDMPASKAGIKIGDRIVKVDDTEVLDSKQLTAYIKGSNGKQLTLSIVRDGKPLTLQMVTEVRDLGDGKEVPVIGVVLSDNAPKIIGHPNPWKQFMKIVNQTGRTLGSLIFHSRGAARIKVSHMSGPIGIVTMMWYSLKNEGLRGGFALIILITFSLAMMNLLPIPALDGSYIFLSIIEIIARRRVPPKILSILINAFFYLLLALIVYISYFDGRRVFRLIKFGNIKGAPAKVEKVEQPKLQEKIKPAENGEESK